MGTRIPIEEAKRIATEYNYEQVIILAQKKHKKPNWPDGWVTTYNADKSKCKFLGKVGAILIYNLRAFYFNKKITEEYYKKIQDKGEK